MSLEYFVKLRHLDFENVYWSFYILYRHDDDFKNTNLTPQQLRKIITNELDNYKEMSAFLENPLSPTPRKASARIWKLGMRKDKIYVDEIFIRLVGIF